MSDGIVFQVDTTRILQILSSEIYDSSLAMLRENLQNAYDAVRMRFARSGALQDGGQIEVVIEGKRITISDNGVGMTEDVLRKNFWKAGSSGKHSDDARRAGVVGTFGIGAMANFGVCSSLQVETRAENSSEVLRSVAERANLRIAEECIALDRVESERDVGTTVTATLDDQHVIGVDQAIRYLEQYVALVPVPISVNGKIISGSTFEDRLRLGNRRFTSLDSATCADNLVKATFDVQVDVNSQVLVNVTAVTIGGVKVEGSLHLLQAGGQLHGMRSYFGLAPIPSSGAYQFGGFANLSFLKPTAGREALSRESIQQVSRLIELAERAASESLAKTPHADNNNALLQWIIAHGAYKHAQRVSIQLVPDDVNVQLGEVTARVGKRVVHYYTGADRKILSTFASASSCLLHVAQGKPRRSVQLHYIRNILKIAEVPDRAQITRVYKGTELGVAEASCVLRVASILREDYLIADVEVALAEISHGVAVLSEHSGEGLRIYIARNTAMLEPVLKFYDQAYSMFVQFMKDFVRTYIYPRIQDYVPSSTRDGVDALRKMLERNRELYRYEETERGDLEGILGEYRSGSATFLQVLAKARSSARPQTQLVFQHQVGKVEEIVPSVVESPVVDEMDAGNPRPPILREDVVSDMKVLTSGEKHPQLNGFQMLLGLSDKLMREESDFFRVPHTTRILWGGHRVIYIFTEATGRLSLYYDIELRETMDAKTGGGEYVTTTLITKKRIFVPVPAVLAGEFTVSAGPREFYVRFDILVSDVS